MKQIIRKTVLTLTAFMSVNSAFANSLPPTCENKADNSLAVANNKNEGSKAVANSLTPTPEKPLMADYKKAMANTLPPTFDYSQRRSICKQAIRLNIRAGRERMS